MPHVTYRKVQNSRTCQIWDSICVARSEDQPFLRDSFLVCKMGINVVPSLRSSRDT